MAESWRDNKALIAALSVAVVGVWGAVGWSVWSSVRVEEAPNALPPIATTDRPVTDTAEPVPYDAAFRDPYAPYVVLQSASASRSTGANASDPYGDPYTGPEMSFEEALDYGYGDGTPEEPFEPPPWVLRGIVGETVILELGPRTVVAKAGDLVGTMEVVRVDDIGVVLRSGSHTFTLMP